MIRSIQMSDLDSIFFHKMLHNQVARATGSGPRSARSNPSTCPPNLAATRITSSMKSSTSKASVDPVSVESESELAVRGGRAEGSDARAAGVSGVEAAASSESSKVVESVASGDVLGVGSDDDLDAGTGSRAGESTTVLGSGRGVAALGATEVSTGSGAAS